MPIHTYIISRWLCIYKHFCVCVCILVYLLYHAMYMTVTSRKHSYWYNSVLLYILYAYIMCFFARFFYVFWTKFISFLFFNKDIVASLNHDCWYINYGYRTPSPLYLLCIYKHFFVCVCMLLQTVYKCISVNIYYILINWSNWTCLSTHNISLCYW